jgi:hypothetical protein
MSEETFEESGPHVTPDPIGSGFTLVLIIIGWGALAVITACALWKI